MSNPKTLKAYIIIRDHIKNGQDLADARKIINHFSSIPYLISPWRQIFIDTKQAQFIITKENINNAVIAEIQIDTQGAINSLNSYDDSNLQIHQIQIIAQNDA